MAKGCTIPCGIDGVEWRIRNRAIQDALSKQLPALGFGLLLLLASPVLIAVAAWQVAVVAALFAMLGLGAIAGTAVLGTQDFVRLGVPAELDRIIDEHEAEIFPDRVAALRAVAARLTYDSASYRERVTQFVRELREATGEAWRCPCRKRRLPIPLPLPF